MKHTAMIIIVFTLSVNYIRAQFPERHERVRLGITETTTWLKMLKFGERKDSSLYEIRHYDSLGNEIYYYKNLRHFGWDQEQETYTLFKDTLPVHITNYVNKELKYVVRLTYNDRDDVQSEYSWGYPDPDTFQTHFSYTYNSSGNPIASSVMRVGNYSMDTLLFYSEYQYDSLDREVLVIGKNENGQKQSEYQNTYNSIGLISEMSEEYFGEDYQHNQEWFQYYPEGLRSVKTDENNNRYEYYYDRRGLLYYMLYIDRSGNPATGFYYLHKLKATTGK